MDLILPDYGLLFWTGLVFCLLLFLLAKYAWKPILNAVNAREQKIQEALDLADKTRAEMQLLNAENEKILKEARSERDSLIKDAQEIVPETIPLCCSTKVTNPEAIKCKIGARPFFVNNEIKADESGCNFGNNLSIIRIFLSDFTTGEFKKITNSFEPSAIVTIRCISNNIASILFCSIDISNKAFAYLIADFVDFML